MAKPKLVIFDSDGTLVDSEYLGHLAMENQLKIIGIEELATSMMENHRGAKLATVISAIEDKHNITLDEAFIQSYRIEVVNLFNNELKEMEGITEALKSLSLPLCVASGGPMAKIEQALSITKLDKFFDGNIFSSYVVNSWKPDPGLFLHAAKTMGVKPEDCIVIEDSPIGLEAAYAANMQSVFYNPHGLTSSVGATHTIKHMCELKSKIA